MGTTYVLPLKGSPP
jgi:hypothetical protein